MSPLVRFASVRAWRAVQKADRDIYEAAAWLAGAAECVRAVPMRDEERDRAQEWLCAVREYIRDREAKLRAGGGR